MKLDEYEIEAALRAGDWRRAADCLIRHFDIVDVLPPLNTFSFKAIDWTSWSLSIYYGTTAWHWDDFAGFYAEDLAEPSAPKATITYCEEYPCED